MKKTQAQRVLDYMAEFGSITPLDAFRDLGVMRLGARIFDLKREGFKIVGKSETIKNRYGEHCTIKRYSLEEYNGEVPSNLA